MILAIDPGPKMSAYVIWDSDDKLVFDHGKLPNPDIYKIIDVGAHNHVVIEMIEGRGMAVGASVFETVLWIGRFDCRFGDSAHLIYRRAVKLHMCGNARARDSNVRQAVIDRVGAPGTKKQPGVTYGIHGDEWQALALALTYDETTIHIPRPAA